MRSLNAPPPREAQVNLKETLTIQNYFLACACRPVRDMEIALMSEALKQEVGARVVALNRLNTHILEITLQCDVPLDYRGGQAVILLNRDNVGKQFSIASPSSNRFSGRIDVHVERVAGCCFCEWLHDHLQVGDLMKVFGPSGQMFYVPGNARQASLLAGWNGGLGGVLGIMQDVFERGHEGPVYLFHGVQDGSHLYLVDEIEEVQTYYPNFRYVACIAAGPVPEGCVAGEAHEIIKRVMPNLSGCRIFLSGPRDFVDRLRRQAYLDGASIKDILFEITAV
jgi:ferredoxin-NADP reductase